MTKTNHIDIETMWDNSHVEYIPPSFQPIAPTKHTLPMREVQADRRNTRKEQPERIPETLSSRKDEFATEGKRPQDGQQDTTILISHGGPDCSASSSNRKAPPERYYDPLLGNHHIPVVEAPDLMEQIVDEANFLQAIAAVGKDPNKAAGCDHRTVKEVYFYLLTNPTARERIRQRLLRGNYHPAQVRTVQIPKPNGKKRTLGIATVQDRIVQTMMCDKMLFDKSV